MRIIVMCVVVATACGSTNHPSEPHTEPSTAPVEVPPLSSVARIPRCGPPESPALTSYLEVRAGDGVVRHVEVVRDPNNGVWLPTEHIRMPMHHATAIRWTNIADLSLLPQSHNDRLRFAFTLLTRDTVQAAQREWRTEYMAEVSTVCAVTGDSSRTVGVHVPDVYAAPDDCVQKEDAVEASVRTAAQCTSDTQCVVRDAPACDLRGVGCYWVAVHRDADMAPIEAAIRTHETSGCPTSDCDCAGPPQTARCVDGQCRADP